MKKVAVIEGGYSKEKAISIKSAKTVFDNLDRTKFDPIRVLIDENEWTAYDDNGRYSIDKNDFSFVKNGSKNSFEYAFIVIHGTPGEDGKLLSLMLSYIGLNKNNCYFSNLVFWRPPGNRVPNKEEIKICLPFTREHIKIIQPKLLVLVGGIAANSILNFSESVTKLRGREFSYQIKEKKIKVHIIYHPSFLINSPIEKKRTWFDLTEISKIIENEKY